MFKIILGICFILSGLPITFSALKIQKTKDISLIKNNIVDIDKIKDKYSYIKFSFNITITVGIVCIIQGMFTLLSIWFPIINSILFITNIIVILIIFIYTYLLVFKAPKL